MAQGPTPFPNGIYTPVTFLRARAFSTLPANPQLGMSAIVSDSATAVVGAVISGGGTNKVSAFYNGSNWVVAGGVASLGAAASQTALTTVGNGTLLAAALLSTDILRSGPTGAFTDTTDTAAAIQTAWTGASSGSSFVFTYQNNTAFAATLAAGSGVTLSGNVVVPAFTWTRFLVVNGSAGSVAMANIEAGPMSPLPPSQFTTSAVTVGTIAAGVLTGAQDCFWLQTGATPGAQTTRTAAQMLADTPNGRVGMTTQFRIANSGAGTLTLTADASVTLNGANTIAQNTWRDYLLTFNSATTATIQYVGGGTF